MILIDSSAWIHFLRTSGSVVVRARVTAALENGDAVWCPIIRLELWNGARGEREKKVLREFERVLPELPITSEVWSQAFDMARRCRLAAVTVPATDLLIDACARFYGAQLEHDDADFNQIAKALA